MSKKATETTPTVYEDQGHKSAVAIQQSAQALAKEAEQYGLSSADMRIPTLLLMQPMSTFVGDGKAKLGDIVNNDSETIIASFDKPFECVPLYKFDTLRVYDVSSGSPKFLHETPYVKGQRFQAEGMEQNNAGQKVPVKRYHTVNFFVLPVQEDMSTSVPALIRFKSTGMLGGEKLASHMWRRLSVYHKPPYDYTVTLTPDRKKNDKGQTWAILQFKEGKPTSTEGQERAREMLAQINSKKYSVVDRGEEPATDEEVVTAAKPVVVDHDVVGKAQGDY